MTDLATVPFTIILLPGNAGITYVNLIEEKAKEKNISVKKIKRRLTENEKSSIISRNKSFEEIFEGKKVFPDSHQESWIIRISAEKNIFSTLKDIRLTLIKKHVSFYSSMSISQAEEDLKVIEM